MSARSAADIPLPAGIRVLSVDVFDTLLFRAARVPSAVFPRVGARARALDLLAARVTDAQFASVRAAAEHAARRGARKTRGSAEVTLAEIYAEMPDEWFPAGARALPAIERAVEAEGLEPNPRVLALVEHAVGRGIDVVAASDTYFPEADLRVLIDAAGVSLRSFAAVLSSSDLRASKHDGGLFGALRSRWPDVDAAAIAHLGDHPWSDVEQPRRAGLTVLPFDNGRAHLTDVDRLETLRHGEVLSEVLALRALATTADAPDDRDLAWWHRLGAGVLGPFFAALADWVVEECVREGITTVRPLLREGALFSTLITRAAQARGSALDVAPLAASRSATWLAGLPAIDEAAIASWLQRRHLTVREALAVFGIDVDADVPQLTRWARTSMGEAAQTPVADDHTLADALADVIRRPDVRTRAELARTQARDRLRRFLDAHLGDAATIALVDLGFHGSTGRSLQSVLATPSPGAGARRVVQLLAFGADSLETAWARGEDIRVFGPGPGVASELAGPIVRHPALLEALLVEGGTTEGYDDRGGTVVARMAGAQASAVQQVAGAACRAGILAYQRVWLPWAARRQTVARQMTADRRQLAAPLHRLLTMPTLEEATRLGDWVHEDNLGGSGSRVLTQPSDVPAAVGARDFLRATASGAEAFGVAWAWPAGTAERRWPGAIEALWHDARGSVDGAPPAIARIARRLRHDGVRVCRVWGAGEVGLATLRALASHGVAVRGVLDSNPALHGRNVEGVTISRPESLTTDDRGVLVVASLAFAGEIAAQIAALVGPASEIRVVRLDEESRA